MMSKRFLATVALAVGCINGPVIGCFILVLTDGQNVIVGNHEDWFEQDAAIRIIPPAKDRFGSVVFTFESEGWAQGGMNSEGLFFDGALTPLDILEREESKPELDGYLWQKILDECSTVRQAVDTAMKYRKMELEEVHIVLADATGDVALIGTTDGDVNVTFKDTNDPYLLQTNFNPTMPELSDEPFCWRYEAAQEHLAGQNEATTGNMLEILQKTHQDELTVYTNIYDLTARRILIYSQRQFDHPISISIEQAFEEGAAIITLEDLLKTPNRFD